MKDEVVAGQHVFHPSSFRLHPLNGASEVCRGQSVFEGVRAVDEDDGDVHAVAPLEFGVGEDVDLLEGELSGAARPLDLAPGVLAEVAARLRVEDDVRFGSQFEIVCARAGGRAPRVS